MKSGASAVRWRPVAGVVFAGALMVGVGAFAAPRTGGDTSARVGKGTSAVQSESASLLSGSGENLQAVIAGGPAGAKIEMFPVPAAVGAYPAGTTIGEFNYMRPSPKFLQPYNEIALDAGGVRIWAEWKYSGWDPNGDDLIPAGSGVCTPASGTCGVGSTPDLCCSAGRNSATPCLVNSDCDRPTLSVAQGTLVGAGMLDSDLGENLLNDTTDDGDQADLAPAYVSCPSTNAAGNAVCVGVFGTDAKCLGGIGGCPFSLCCTPMFYNKTGSRADNVCAGVVCQGDCTIAAANINWGCFAGAEFPDVLHDPGSKTWGGTFVVDVPSAAKGRYFIELNKIGSTFMSDRQSPPEDIPLSESSGMAVFIRTGSCCFALGTPGQGCTDALLKSECGDDEVAPFIWTVGKTCAEGCVECVDDAGCNDNDACTIDTCNTAIGVCNRPLIPGFDPLTECCDPASGTVVTRDDGDVCTGDVCTLANSRGTASHPILPASTPCLDGNPCTTGDHCNGISSQADGGCGGSDVNAVACVGGVCPVLNELDNSAFACSATDPSTCFCTLTPDLDYVVINSIKNPACDGGQNSGFFCESDDDCPGGVCDQFAHGGNCFDAGSKIQARVHIGAAGAPINGGEFLLQFDPSCVSLNSITPLAPYLTTIYGPVYGSGSVFIAIGVDPFGGLDGPLGNVDVLALSFTKVGECDECLLCFGQNNPMHTYLTDNTGQRIDVAPNCKGIRELPTLTLDIPGSIKTNVDCDRPSAIETWDAASASSSCGAATITCRGAHESGLQYAASMVSGGGEFPIGSSSFCCAASEEDCDQVVGCAGTVNDCAIDSTTGKAAGCWTVEVNDETSLDIDVQLSPPITHNDANGELTRCIKFSLYSNCIEAPLVFSTDVTFGGMFNFSGKVVDKIKIPSSGQFDCVTAQDQLHTLRSCYTFLPGDCAGGQLSASFEGDPELGGNWLIGGNLDGWKKNDGDPSSNPSLDVIDILDFGTFVGQSGNVYADNDTPCNTPGPNGDINGDGVADSSDYAYIIRNFLVSQKDCCCPGGQQGSEANPVSSITVDQLIEQGLGDLAVADLNGDGVVDTADMDAYSQGARPTKSNNNRGGKGVRSGR